MSRRRRSGVLVPLFSLTSTTSWGVGEFLDVPKFAEWLSSAGQSFVQVLPTTEIPEGETSPYSALTAMALDPLYVSLPALEDFQAIGGEKWFSHDERAHLDGLRNKSRVDHRRIRPFKTRWLRRAFEHFAECDIRRRTPRALRLAGFVQDEAWWLDDYAIFFALRGKYRLRPWWEWPEPLVRRDPDALRQASTELTAEIAYCKYVQWVAAEQWAEARRLARPLRVFGDLPFMIAADSADVWIGQHEFRTDATVGVPPDAFSDTGQDWGLPPWRWEVMADNDYAWMRRRARRSADLFDGLRIDHLVGLYRTFVRPTDLSVKPFFAPPDEAAQIALGERLVKIYLESGAEVVAEDLGTVPDFVRASLQRLGVPGFKVFRWERQWAVDGQPFIDPLTYPESSVATTGTHDTEPLASWWEDLPQKERALVLQIPSVRRFLSGASGLEHAQIVDVLPPALLDALLVAVLEAGSRVTVIPVQDLFGWRDRINTPARVDDKNWTWRLPWPVDRLHEVPEARERAQQLAAWSGAANRR